MSLRKELRWNHVWGAVLVALVAQVLVGCGSADRWVTTDGPASDAAPAIAAHPNGRIFLAATGRSGDVQYTATTTPGSFAVWQSIAAAPAGGFSRETAPALVRTRAGLRAYARGADDNLYRSQKIGDGPWGPWTAIIDDASVLGRFSVAVTHPRDSVLPPEDHIVYVSDGRCRYLRHTGLGRPEPRDWPGCLEAVIASDEVEEIGVVLRFEDQMQYEVALRGTGWTFQTFLALSREGVALSNLVRAHGSYHVVFANRDLTDDVAHSYRHRLLHAWFEAQTGHAKLRQVALYNPVEDRHARPALTAYRNRLLTTWTSPGGKVRSARWDNADPKLVWIEYGITGGGQSRHRPAIVSFNRRPFVPPEVHGEPHYGDDAYAVIAGFENEGAAKFIILSRAMMREDIAKQFTLYNSQSDNLDPVCRKPSDAFGPQKISNLWAEDRMILTEIGFNLWAFPHWFMETIYYDHVIWHCTDDDGAWDDAATPCHTLRLPVYIKRRGGIFVCRGAWINQGGDYLHVWEELGHYLAGALGFVGDGPTQDAADVSGLSLAVLQAGYAMFDEDTGSCTSADDRCTGFTGYAGNYDNGGVQHSFIYTVLYYLRNGDQLRDFIAEDLDVGSDLLQRKYNWIKDHIFRGVEYRTNLEPVDP